MTAFSSTAPPRRIPPSIRALRDDAGRVDHHLSEAAHCIEWPEPGAAIPWWRAIPRTSGAALLAALVGHGVAAPVVSMPGATWAFALGSVAAATCGEGASPGNDGGGAGGAPDRGCPGSGGVVDDELAVRRGRSRRQGG